MRESRLSRRKASVTYQNPGNLSEKGDPPLFNRRLTLLINRQFQLQQIFTGYILSANELRIVHVLPIFNRFISQQTFTFKLRINR
jgi:hypothetical protein